jgi:hypothetical protein
LIPIFNFKNANTDRKAQIGAGFISIEGLINFHITVFYEHPTAPENIFKEFMAIYHHGVLETRSYLSLIQATSASASANVR